MSEPNLSEEDEFGLGDKYGQLAQQK